MTDPKFSVATRRIEVAYTPEKASESTVEASVLWHVHASVPDDERVLLVGYLRREQQDGFGQVQTIGVLAGEKFVNDVRDKDSRENFQLWVTNYCIEVMYDAGRRALQAQASIMDFAFGLTTEAPEVILHLPPVKRSARRKKPLKAEASEVSPPE